jgi:endogenous inhibitor of DNA gyrase (YacG/DUF329 family)
MSSVQTEVKCEQCGFPNAWKVLDCWWSSDWSVGCPRCGYRESWKHESYFSNGHLERGVNEVLYSAGAYCAKNPNTGIEEQGPLSETEVEQIAAKMRNDIATGKLLPESYLTRYNFDTHEVTALFGQVPIGDETQTEKDRNLMVPERTCSGVQEIEHSPAEGKWGGRTFDQQPGNFHRIVHRGPCHLRHPRQCQPVTPFPLHRRAWPTVKQV